MDNPDLTVKKYYWRQAKTFDYHQTLNLFLFYCVFQNWNVFYKEKNFWRQFIKYGSDWIKEVDIINKI